MKFSLEVACFAVSAARYFLKIWGQFALVYCVLHFKFWGLAPVPRDLRS